jgi:glycosyltransferase involved in cell wall biosynthesis
MIELSIIIPCYNSSKALKELAFRLNEVLTKLNITTEVFFINDCSTDNTVTEAKEIIKKYNNFILIDLMFHVGQFRSLYCGLEHAKGNYIVTMDDDLQHRPEDIEKLYNTIKNNKKLDAIFASYFEKKHSVFRNLGTSLIKFINEKIYNKPKNLKMSAFRIMRRNLLETIINHKTISPVLGAIILKSTNKIINIEVEHDERKYGKSNYNLIKLIKTTFDNVLNFSSLPLQVISIIGFVISMISFTVSIVIIIKYILSGIGVPGWTSMMVLLNFYAGLILLSLGLIGEYLIRILMEVNGTPKYKIRKIYE